METTESIPIDFEVFKALTAHRTSAEVTYNDVLRNLLKLGPEPSRAGAPGGDGCRPWVTKGVTFPHGTEFRARYKGQTYTARADDGAMVVNGRRFAAPSPAAMSIASGSVNGWKFWEARKPGETHWTLMYSLWKPKRS